MLSPKGPLIVRSQRDDHGTAEMLRLRTLRTREKAPFPHRLRAEHAVGRGSG